MARLFQVRKRVSILMYHSVDGNFVSGTPEENFRQQMILLNKKFVPISLRKIVDFVRGTGDVPDKSVAVTFDDGFDDNYTTAFPILSELNIPTTIFVTTSFIDGFVNSYPKEFGKKRGLTREHLSELSGSRLIEIGSHTMSHPKDMRNLSRQEVVEELSTSRMELENLLGKEVGLFAYPMSLCSQDLIKAVQDTGYLGAVCGETAYVRQSMDPYHLPRIGVRKKTKLPELFVRLSGGIFIVRAVKSIKKSIKHLLIDNP